MRRPLVSLDRVAGGPHTSATRWLDLTPLLTSSRRYRTEADCSLPLNQPDYLPRFVDFFLSRYQLAVRVLVNC